MCNDCTEQAWTPVGDSDALVQLLLRNDTLGAVPWDYGLSPTLPGNHAWTDRFRVSEPVHQPHGPHVLLAANPSDRPNVTHIGGGGIAVAWRMLVGPAFSVEATFSLMPDADAISERVSVTRLRRSPGSTQDAFRVRRLFHTSGVPPAQQGSFFSSFHSMGWQHPSTAFLVLATAPEPTWSPRSGSSKMFRRIVTLSRSMCRALRPADPKDAFHFLQRPTTAARRAARRPAPASCLCEMNTPSGTKRRRATTPAAGSSWKTSRERGCACPPNDFVASALCSQGLHSYG